jgi:regulatory protein
VELRRKGVDDDTAQEALEQIDPDTERAAAEALVQRRLRSTRGLAYEARVRRLAGMLARKGYPGGLAMAVVRDALRAEPQTEPDAFDRLADDGFEAPTLD